MSIGAALPIAQSGAWAIHSPGCHELGPKLKAEAARGRDFLSVSVHLLLHVAGPPSPAPVLPCTGHGGPLSPSAPGSNDLPADTCTRVVCIVLITVAVPGSPCRCRQSACHFAPWRLQSCISGGLSQQTETALSAFQICPTHGLDKSGLVARSQRPMSIVSQPPVLRVPCVFCCCHPLPEDRQRCPVLRPPSSSSSSSVPSSSSTAAAADRVGAGFEPSRNLPCGCTGRPRSKLRNTGPPQDQRRHDR